MANKMSMLNNLIILCGHYKGIDYRIREHLITKEISVGDYVLTGGTQNVFIQETEPAVSTGQKALWIDTTGGNLNFWLKTGE
jgi:hypothetical protein